MRLSKITPTTALRMNPLAHVMAALLLCAGWVVGSIGVSSANPDPNEEETSHETQIQEWQDGRNAKLRSASGWLTISGLFWLTPGNNTVGANPESPVVLPSTAEAEVAETVGSIFWDPKKQFVTFTCHVPGPKIPAPEDAVDANGKPIFVPLLPGSTTPIYDTSGLEQTVHLNELEFWVIERNGRIGIRLRDPNSEMRKNFQGAHFFATDSRYRVEAKFRPFEPPKTLAVPSVLGYVDTTESFGELVFSLNSVEYRLLPDMRSAADTTAFLIFEDETTGSETYGGGRFLVARRLTDQTFELDFNRAYNPPCARNPYTTCPLPPKENRLDIEIRAGELAAEDR